MTIKQLRKAAYSTMKLSYAEMRQLLECKTVEEVKGYKKLAAKLELAGLL